MVRTTVGGLENKVVDQASRRGTAELAGPPSPALPQRCHACVWPLASPWLPPAHPLCPHPITCPPPPHAPILPHPPTSCLHASCPPTPTPKQAPVSTTVFARTVGLGSSPLPTEASHGESGRGAWGSPVPGGQLQRSPGGDRVLRLRPGVGVGASQRRALQQGGDVQHSPGSRKGTHGPWGGGSGQEVRGVRPRLLRKPRRAGRAHRAQRGPRLPPRGRPGAAGSPASSRACPAPPDPAPRFRPGTGCAAAERTGHGVSAP